MRRAFYFAKKCRGRNGKIPNVFNRNTNGRGISLTGGKMHDRMSKVAFLTAWGVRRLFTKKNAGTLNEKI
jgi:purine nucleoside phosphorylase